MEEHIASEHKPSERCCGVAVAVGKTILRILLGVFFITAAILKLVSIDNFELYIYSFGFFGYTFCSFVARIVIAAELLSGMLLIAKILYKPVWWLTMAMLAGFTLLLAYTAIFRNDANCHCLGDLIQLAPVPSIIKNFVTMGLMLLIRKERDYRFKGKTAVGLSALAVAAGVPFIAFTPDIVYNRIFGPQTTVDEMKFDEFLQDSTIAPYHLDEGRYILGFLAAGCEYCKTSGLKLNMMMEANALDTNRVVFVIWGNDKAVQDFKDKTGAAHYKYIVVSPLQVLDIVGGKFPTYLLVEDGKCTDVIDLRGIEEKTVAGFLGGAGRH